MDSSICGGLIILINGTACAKIKSSDSGAIADLWYVFINEMCNSVSISGFITVVCPLNDEGEDFFKFHKQLIVTTNYKMVLDYENYTEESSR